MIINGDIFFVFLITAIIIRFAVPYLHDPIIHLEPELADWLEASSLDRHAAHFHDNGAITLHRAVEVPAVASLSLQEQEAMTAAVYKLKEKLLFEHYLTSRGVTVAQLHKLSSMGIHSLKEASYMARQKSIYPEEFPQDEESKHLFSILDALPRTDIGCAELAEDTWRDLAVIHHLPSAARPVLELVFSSFFGCCLLVVLIVAIVASLCSVWLMLAGVVKNPKDLSTCPCNSPVQQTPASTPTATPTRTTQGGDASEDNTNDKKSTFLPMLNLVRDYNNHSTASPSNNSPNNTTTLRHAFYNQDSPLTQATPPSSTPCHHHTLPTRLNNSIYRIGSNTLSLLGLLALVFHVIVLFLLDLLYIAYNGMTRSIFTILIDHQSLKPRNLLHLFTGKYLHPKKCLTTFHWQEPTPVGTTVSFTIAFFQRNGRPYPISDADNVVVIVTQGVHKVNVLSEVGGSGEQHNSIRCKFSARQAGDHTISVMVVDRHVKGSPFSRTFLSGPPCLQNTTLVGHTSTVVCVAKQQHTLLLEPRDQYQNLCVFEDGQEESADYTLQMSQASESAAGSVECSSVVGYDTISKRYTVDFLLQAPGCYEATLAYKGDQLPQGGFAIIVLEDSDNERVRRYLCRRQLDGLEAQVVPVTASSPGAPHSPYTKHKKVYCYITPKQLIVKEYLLMFIPIRLCTFRLCPSTKLQFSSSGDTPMLTIDDGCQPPITLASKDRDVIAATFTQFLLKNIGGSETFEDKQDHFYHEVKVYHNKRPHERLPLVIVRDKVLESSMKATRNFSVSDWCRCFEIRFLHEEALDWGGVTREWVELLCTELFDSGKGLFASFNEDSPQALVHPNPLRPSHFKLKHYEFAGRLVGKCLYESARGGKYHQTVRARFTRSFLAQIIGLRVHYAHFAQDDPELYQGKVQHLLQHGTSLLDDPLYFTDQLMTQQGTLKTVELETGGSSMEVTDHNKLRYLDCLAQHRLAVRVHAEVRAFLDGLNEIIPDNLLCLFDENELELLMCGTEKYSIADLKSHHVVSGGSFAFRKVLFWFWAAIANFTEEEMARLLQFTTGCSRLPPGGFAQLSPQFQLMSTHTYNCLPLAHTCFNQLCLPDYDSYDQFEKFLLIAIREGSEGFGLV